MKNMAMLALAAAMAAGSVAMESPARAAAPETATATAKQDAAAKARAAIDRGLAYLKTQQQPDGAFNVPQAPPAITAIALRAFLDGGQYSANDPFLAKAYEKLLTFQGDDGRIANGMLENYNTAIAVTALAAAGDGYRPQMEKAVAFLRAIQWTDKIAGIENLANRVEPNDPAYGGWGYGRHRRPDLSNLQLTMDALHDAGLKTGDPAYEAAIAFVSRTQNRSESNDQSWAGNDGGFVYTAAENGDSEAGEMVDAQGARRLRSYGSMTYAGLKSMIYAGLSKDDPRVKAAWEWIGRNWTLSENPGMGAADPAQRQHGLYYYYMTMGRALEAYGEPIVTDAKGEKHDWRAELIDTLASAQREDGSWVGDKRWMEDSPVLATSYSVLALEDALRDLGEHPAK